jgi:hypothetical protein
MHDKERNALVKLAQFSLVPNWARSALVATLAGRTIAGQSVSVDRHVFDGSYLEFLDAQIGLAARGRQWAELLRARKAAFEPVVDTALLRVGVRREGTEFVAHCRLEDGVVVHTEIVET